MSDIPRPEIDTLIIICGEATYLALEGEAGDGYQALLAGQYRAQEFVREEDQPWGNELLIRWQRAVDEYAARWRVGRA